MDNTQLDDLKQFITATVGQAEARLETKIDQLDEKLSKKMDDGFSAIAEIVDSHNDQLDNHETRITKLEQKAA